MDRFLRPSLWVCFSREDEGCTECYSLYAHINCLQSNIDKCTLLCSKICCGRGWSIFSCFIHELINSTRIALISIPTNAQPACVCLLRHSSVLAEGHRKQHKLSIQLYAPQKFWHNMRPWQNPLLSLGPLQFDPILEHWEWSFLSCVFVLRESQLGFCMELYCCSFSAQWHCQLWWRHFLIEPMCNSFNGIRAVICC